MSQMGHSEKLRRAKDLGHIGTPNGSFRDGGCEVEFADFRGH